MVDTNFNTKCDEGIQYYCAEPNEIYCSVCLIKKKNTLKLQLKTACALLM